jgi:hypothetical protein
MISILKTVVVFVATVTACMVTMRVVDKALNNIPLTKRLMY